MAFVSRNPHNILNPETADGCVLLTPEKMKEGQEFIGFFKNMYVEPTYNNKCYVFKGKDDGKDYLIFGCTSLHKEMAFYTIGDLVCVTYEGVWVNKNGKFSGKSSRIWKVKGDTDWFPNPEFVNQLNQEVLARRAEVQRQLASPQAQTMNAQRPNAQVTGYHPNNGHSQFQNAPAAPVSQNPFINPYGASKPTNPFG